MIASAMCASLGQAQDAPEKLTWDNYEDVKKFVSLSEKETLYKSIDWKETVQEGQLAGQTADKPIMLWLYFGNPLANC